MIDSLVINGCSYMEVYAQGQGHVDLAQRLGLASTQSLAMGGSANSRIIRTTLKHSYKHTCVFYVLGLTFLSREEIPILNPLYHKIDWDMEGRWTNPQNQSMEQYWQTEWSQQDTKRWVELKLKTDFYSIPDRLEHLQYILLAMIHSLHARGHKVLIYQQADPIYQSYLEESRFKFLKIPEIIGGLTWQAIPWQDQQGVPVNDSSDYVTNPYGETPRNMKHRKAGAHDQLNEFLTNYIKDYKILQ